MQIIVSALLILSADDALSAGRTASDPSGSDELSLFQSDELLELTLTFNMEKFIRDVGDDHVYHPAIISYLDERGDTVSIPLRIRTRGHFRKDPGNCNFPPIKLNFKTKLTRNTIFEGTDKIKLVTHCNTRRSVFEQFVLKEYMAYKIYNLFTEESFRARLARVTYVDSTGQADPVERFAFFIEPEEYLASRNHSNLVEIKNVNQFRTDKEKMLVLAVYQYMIGNTDWSVPNLHNIRLLQDEPGATPIAVPYDFDWSGLVNAPYAYPAPHLGIEHVTERLFRGFCRSGEEYLPVFELFNQKKTDIYKMIESSDYLEAKYKRRTLNFLDHFYKTINNPRAVKYEFYEKCR